MNLDQGYWYVKDRRWLEQWTASIPEECFPFDFDVRKKVNPRTPKQNNAIHLYFQMLAKDLNDQAWTVSKLIELTETLGEVPWTPYMVKELIWRKIQVALYDIESTTKIDTKQINKIYSVVSMNMAKIAGVSTPFPSADDA